MTEIIIVAHNIRSAHNIGAIFRTAEGFGIRKIILSGYSPYPKTPSDTRLPHIAEKLHKQIHKTALGAEEIVQFEYQELPNLAPLRTGGFRIVGLEQTPNSSMLTTYSPPGKLALILGEEVSGISSSLLNECEDIIEIPMRGEKESFNVSVATGVALYGLLYGNRIFT